MTERVDFANRALDAYQAVVRARGAYEVAFADVLRQRGAYEGAIGELESAKALMRIADAVHERALLELIRSLQKEP